MSRGILSRLVLERVLPSFSPSFGRSGAAVVGRRGARAVFLMKVCRLLDVRAFFFSFALSRGERFFECERFDRISFHFSSISDFNFNFS